MQHTKIEWADHTFNPVRGCSKVSDGCKHCYAETMSKRNQAVLGIWGPQGTRVEASRRAWLEVHRWNRSAKKAGRRHTVFCASMSDIGEDRPEWVGPRQRLTETVLETPWLTWLLLTKRPENLARLFAELIDAEPDNVWWGASVENQEMANERIPHLIQMPGHHFLSCEPLLGFVDIEKWAQSIQWVIAGGESGPRARPMHPHWTTYLRDQCKHAGIPFFFKQWGHWVPNDSHCWEQTHYPEWDQCRTVWPSGKTARGGSGTYMDDGIDMFPAGKKEAGNMIYTEFYEEFPWQAERESVDLDGDWPFMIHRA